MIGPFRPDKRVIALHDIDDAELFREKMVWLKERYDILPLDRLLSAPQGGRTQVAITFDDGAATQYERAVPVLRELALPATFFLCSGFIGLAGEAARDFARHRLRRIRPLRPLMPHEVRAMAHDPLFSIGSHTSCHEDLGTIASPAAIEAVMADKRVLEALTGVPVRWFAYPFGRRPNIPHPAVGPDLLVSGFSGAFTIVPGTVDSRERGEIPRSCLDIHGSLWQWTWALGGGYDWTRYVRN